MSQRERRSRLRLKAAKDPSCIPHGTSSGYDLYGCRCDQCRSSHAERNRKYLKTESGRASSRRKSILENVVLQGESMTPNAVDRRWQRWTGRELEYLVKNRETVAAREMARALGRTFYSTKKALERLDVDPDAVRRGGFTTGSRR